MDGYLSHGRVTSWNAAAERMFGYLAEEIIGQDVSLLVPGDLKQELAGAIGGAAAGERTRHLTTVRVRKDGVLIDVSVTLSPIRDADGQGHRCGHHRARPH